MYLKLYCTFFCNLLVNLHGYLTESSYARILLNHAILLLVTLLTYSRNSTPKIAACKSEVLHVPAIDLDLSSTGT